MVINLSKLLKEKLFRNAIVIYLYDHLIKTSHEIWPYPINKRYEDMIYHKLIEQLSDSLIAQLVEYCTDIPEVMGLNPVQAWIFFSGLNFTTAVYNCSDQWLIISS